LPAVAERVVFNTATNKEKRNGENEASAARQDCCQEIRQETCQENRPDTRQAYARFESHFGCRARARPRPYGQGIGNRWS
jgi:hypothetical protein